MPIYDYECEECGLVVDVIAGINDREIVHNTCGKVMRRVLHSKFGIHMAEHVPTGGYYDPHLGAFIQTAAQKRRLMREQGVTHKGDTPKNEGGWF